MKLSLPHLRIYIFSILLGIFLVLEIAAISRESLTFDEPFVIQEGVTNLTYRQFPIEPYNPPLARELYTLPMVLWPTETPPLYRSHEARILAVMTSVGIAVIMYLWTQRHEKPWVGVLGISLLLFDPTFFANAHYATPDIVLTLSVLSTILAFEIFLHKPTLLHVIFFGVAFGAAASSKISGLVYVIGIIFSLCFFHRETFSWSRHWSRRYKYLAAFGAAMVVVWGCFGFRLAPALTLSNDSQRLSSRIVRAASNAGIGTPVSLGFKFLQMPLPAGDYIALLKNSMLRGKATDRVSLLEQISTISTKVSLPFILLVFVGVIIMVNRKVSGEKWWLFGLGGVVMANIFLGLPPLIRYYLPAFPFFALIAGYGAWQLWLGKGRWLVIGLCIWHLAEFVSVYPYTLTYANELAGSASKRYLWLRDSNYDHGQGLRNIAEYVHAHPETTIRVSYFGRDIGERYGLTSLDGRWGSHKSNEICQFHTVAKGNSGSNIDLISPTNWWECKYYTLPQYSPEHVHDVLPSGVLVFINTY